MRPSSREQQRQRDQEVDRQARCYGEAVLRQGSEGVEAELGHRRGHQTEDADRQEADDAARQGHHHLERRPEEAGQNLLVRGPQAGDGYSQKDREEDHGQHVPPGRGGEEVLRDDVEEQLDRGARGLQFRKRLPLGGPEVGALSRADEVDEGEAGEDGQGARKHVVPQGLSEQPPEGAPPAYRGDAADDGDDHQGDDDHAQQAHEQGAEPAHPGCGGLAAQKACGYSQDHGGEHLPVKLAVPRNGGVSLFGHVV